MEDSILQLEKTKKMEDFLKENKISKYLRENMSIDYPSILQANAIPIIKSEDNVIIQYTPPAGVKLTCLLPLLSRGIKAKAKASGGKSIEILIVTCASKARCNEMLATIKPILENEKGETLLDI